MPTRKIVIIDEEKCNGCGECVTACAEAAIEIIDGKAKLISEIYCDGLGACLGQCPQDAITIEDRQAEDFDEEKTNAHIARQKAESDSPAPTPAAAQSAPAACSCPGQMAKQFSPKAAPEGASADVPSQLAQWPVQLTLVSPAAPYFKNADLLLVADCVPFAMSDFHAKLLKGKAIAIACPKLDEVDPYIEKLAAIIESNDLNSLTVIHMQVPCCSGLTYIAQKAIAQSGQKITFEDTTITLQGEIMNTQTIEA